MMEWANQQIGQVDGANNGSIGCGGAATGGGGRGGVFVKVMTDEQMEVLRKQIAVYAAICETLVDLHKSLTSQHDLSGVRLGSLYCDPLVTSAGHRITGRQRWTPTPVQLQILEHIFDQGNGTPSKQKIKDITSELSQHGQISETNVYNWFQNRRARSKRKQQVTVSKDAESEVETEVESSNEKNLKPDVMQLQSNDPLVTDNLFCQKSETSSGMISGDQLPDKVEPVFAPEDSSNSDGSFSRMSFYQSILANPRMEQFIGKMETGNCGTYMQEEDYSM